MSPITKDVISSFITAAILVAIVVAIAAIGGCVDLTKRPVAIQVKTVEVVKAVPVPCVDPADIPSKTATVMPEPTADAARKAAGAYVDMHHLVDENEQLRALLIQCTQGGKP